MRSLNLLLVMAIAAWVIIPVTALAQLADSPWPTYKGNNQHTGQSSYDTSHIDGTLKWSFDTGAGVESSVAIGPDGTLYVGGFGSNFYALNPDGTEKWHFTEPRGWFRSTASIAKDGTIYIGAVIDNKKHPLKMFEYGKPLLYALNPDGIKKWEFSTGGSYDGIYISPTIAPDGTIYTVSGGEFETADVGKGGKLWAINPDGIPKWNFDAREDSSVKPDTICGFGTTPALAKDGTMYIASSCGDRGRVFAITPEGKEKWFFPSENFFDGTPTIGPDGTIYAGSWDKNLYALTPEGKEKWRFTTTAPVEASPSIGTDGTIYVGTISVTETTMEMTKSIDKNLYALNPDGTEKWRFSTDNGIDATPAIGSDGTIYFGSYDGNLYALNPDGTEKWRFKTGGGIVANPSIDKDGTIYFGSWDKKVYALGDPSIKNEKGPEQNKINLVIILIAASIPLLAIATTAIFVWRKKRDEFVWRKKRDEKNRNDKNLPPSSVEPSKPPKAD